MMRRTAGLLAALCLNGCASPGGFEAAGPESAAAPQAATQAQPAEPSRGERAQILARKEAAASMPMQMQTQVPAQPLVKMPTRQIVVVLSASRRPQWEQIETALAAQYRLRPLRKFPLVSIDVQCIVYEVPEGASLDALARRLRKDPRVDDAQPNRTFTSLAQTEPYADLQWGRNALVADGFDRRATGKGVKVAIVDTGADAQHPDLRSSIAETVDLVKAEGEPFNADPHGTAVAGVIAANAGNRIGIAGIAPDARLMIVKACRQNGQAKALCLSWTIARAIDAAIVAKARVINLSLSGPPDALIARLVKRADESGIVVVAAAEARSPSFPASLAEVIGVLASDSNGAVDKTAWRKPGGLIAAPGFEVLTTVPGGSYDFQSGSSLSSAHISGLVALLLELAPAETPRSMREALMRSSRTTPRVAAQEGERAGTPDAQAVLRAISDPR